MSSAPPKVVCILVNWNGWQDTLDCLAALRAQDYSNLSVIVVDNGSSNDSVARLRSAHPWATLHALPVNIGFAAGCNAGLRLAYAAGADLLWSLNNDTVPPPMTCSAIVETFLGHPEAGAIGAVLYFRHDPDKVQAWGGGRIDLQTAYVRHFHAPASFDEEGTFFTGASIALPRRVCEEVGILYEGYFMYCDDVDLCLRIRRSGHPLVMCRNTAILHKEGASSPRRSPLIDEFVTTSTVRMLFRQAPAPLLSVAVYLTLRVVHRLLRGEWKNLAGTLRGVGIFLSERKRVFSDRL